MFKVGRNKLFAMMTHQEGECELTVKLTDEEREVAMHLAYVRRASYVGRYGWVTVKVRDEESLQSALEWLRESFWLNAPKHLRDAHSATDVRCLGAMTGTRSTPPRTAGEKSEGRRVGAHDAGNPST